MSGLEKEIIKLLNDRGPLTGSEILNSTEVDELLLWRICRHSKRLMIRRIGTRYLRLDRRVEGFARLSPSILREFLTYTVVGLSGDSHQVDLKADRILHKIEEVSRAKAELAFNIVSSLGSQLENELSINDQVCFILAGDIVYNMAHDVPRPERSTGKLVRGSDMDLVVIVDDQFPEKSMERLDENIFKEKYRILITPHIREEIDYIVKNLARVRTQVQFDTFKHMVACKILQEGTLLYGSEFLFNRVKSILKEYGITQKLLEMEKQARIFRKKAEAILMNEAPDKIREGSSYLFYPTEESEEFE
ncbi:MAG: hypothetical protein JRJ85_07945 [Deltaproteobacteria bacterium]|nr:hypothetical protein [Deltaproteobacteria bacterium]